MGTHKQETNFFQCDNVNEVPEKKGKKGPSEELFIEPENLEGDSFKPDPNILNDQIQLVMEIVERKELEKQQLMHDLEKAREIVKSHEESLLHLKRVYNLMDTLEYVSSQISLRDGSITSAEPMDKTLMELFNDEAFMNYLQK
ncbi:9258_t:CDS:2, partial [Acaulospora colombiana]